MAELAVSIVTPSREVYTGPASDVTVPGWEGEFQVLPGHDLFLSLLRGGLVELTTPQGRQRLVIGRGFAEASPDQVTILTDSAEPAEDVDKAAAAEDLAAADAALANASYGTAQWETATERREIATARLRA